MGALLLTGLPWSAWVGPLQDKAEARIHGLNGSKGGRRHGSGDGRLGSGPVWAGRGGAQPSQGGAWKEEQGFGTVARWIQRRALGSWGEEEALLVVGLLIVAAV